MKKEYDFADARRGAAVPRRGKTRITLYLDDVVLEAFRAESERTGKGYQTLINEALRDRIAARSKALTPAVVRRIIREELDAKA